MEKRAVTSKEIKEEMKFSVCSRTIRNRLNGSGIFNHFAPKRPFISEINREKRLKWAQRSQRLDFRPVERGSLE